jgi:serine/threonine protein kinase
MTQGYGTTAGGIAAVIDALRTKHGWKLSELIGEGGFAYVYKENIRGLSCAVKISKSPALSTAEQDRLAKELRVLRDFRGHPRLLTLVDYDWVLNHLVTVWELAHGTLAKVASEREAENQED